MKNDKKWQNPKWPPSGRKIVYIDTKNKKNQVKKYTNIFDISWQLLSSAFTYIIFYFY